MTFRIRLQPSGREFPAEPGESVLEAALRSGINLPYHCAGGSCGECTGRILRGETENVRFHDFHLSEAQRAQGQALLCCIEPRSDLVVEAAEISDVSQIPHQRIAARIAKLEEVGDDYRVLHLRTPRSRTLRFLAGQHVQLTADGPDGRLEPKDLAIASCPCNGMQLQFHLRRKPEDPFCEHIFHTAHIGDSIDLKGPFGDFTLDERSHRPIVMVGVDTGFAVLKSLLEHAVNLELSQPIQLHRIATRPNGHYLENYCRAWEDALEAYVYHRWVASEDKEVEKRIVASAPPAAECDLYLAGEAAVTEPVAKAFVAAGTPPERIRRSGMRRA